MAIKQASGGRGQKAGIVEAQGTCVANAPELFVRGFVGNQECYNRRARDD